jgi:PadR family transcriptional regulator PadR
MSTASDPRGQLDLLLLTAVAAGAAHGYRIIERVRERSGGAFDLREGTVYPALHRLERHGLLESRWDDEAPRRRRVYAITARGRAALDAKRREWSSFAGAVQAVIAG